MKWTRFTINTTTAAVDLVVDMLADLGIEGAEILDKVPLSESDKKKMFVDILPELEPDDGKATVNFYIDPDDRKGLPSDEEVIRQVLDGLDELETFVPVGDKKILLSETEDKDWINNWKEFFHAFRIGEDIVIKPTWQSEEEIGVKEGDLVLEIDPGISFGTGAHETTRLCIEALRKFVRKDDLIFDVGCGSGILSIAAVKMGAKCAYAVDIDPIAVDATYENMETNHVGKELITCEAGNIIEDKALQEKAGVEKYDIVVANILADVLVPLTPVVKPCMKKGGLYITSGIIDMKENEVREAIEKAGLEVVEINHLKDWVCIVAKRPL